VSSGPTHLAVGLLKKPHGIKGDVLVFPLTDQPDRVFRVDRRLVVLDKQGVPTGAAVTVRKAKAYHRAWLVHFDGYDDREALLALRDVYLGIEIGEARPLEEGEFFLHELVGLAVQTAEKVPVGTVTKVIEAPQGLLLEVKGEVKEHLIPFRAGIIRRVDREKQMVTVNPPAGLLEL
jgi:16S rRNA processing protein RimM